MSNGQSDTAVRFLSAAEGVALDRTSRLFSGMRRPEALDTARATRVLRIARDSGQRLAYRNGTTVPAAVIEAATRNLFGAPVASDEAEPAAAAA